MKTTVEISDALLRRAKQIAAERGVTLRELLETGLRHVVESEEARKRPFRLRRRPFRGKKLALEGGWDAVRQLIYEGRGG
ncbi:MAG: hypothetical protein RMK57_09840 [Bryobacterales bacterium]|nr:hypothetical protein [Bryobacteraceae bacterium]MDW8354819.1 hypothetical protein [Bryobacterales bacterium]